MSEATAPATAERLSGREAALLEDTTFAPMHSLELADPSYHKSGGEAVVHLSMSEGDGAPLFTLKSDGTYAEDPALADRLAV